MQRMTKSTMSSQLYHKETIVRCIHHAHPNSNFRFKHYIDSVKQFNMTLQCVQASYVIIINEISMMTTNDLIFIYNQMKCATSKGKKSILNKIHVMCWWHISIILICHHTSYNIDNTWKQCCIFNSPFWSYGCNSYLENLYVILATPIL